MNRTAVQRSWRRPVARGVTSNDRADCRPDETLRRRDLEVLDWLGEQYGARVDHIEALLDCGPRTVQRVVARLRAGGLVTTRRLLVGDPAWVIPTSAGLRICSQGFAVW